MTMNNELALLAFMLVPVASVVGTYISVTLFKNMSWFIK